MGTSLSEQQEPGAGRSTVALVAKMVEGVGARVEGVAGQLTALDRIMQSEFKDVQRQLDSVSNLPIVVNGLIEKVSQHDEAIKGMRAAEQKRRDYRIGPLIANLVGLAGVCVAVVAVVVAASG